MFTTNTSILVESMCAVFTVNSELDAFYALKSSMLEIITICQKHTEASSDGLQAGLLDSLSPRNEFLLLSSLSDLQWVEDISSGNQYHASNIPMIYSVRLSTMPQLSVKCSTKSLNVNLISSGTAK